MHQWKKHKKLNTTLSTRGTLENVHHCFSYITFKLINSSSSLNKNNAVPRLGIWSYLAQIFYDFISTLSPKFQFQLRKYTKLLGECLTKFPNTSKFTKNTAVRVVFSTLFSDFGNVVKQDRSRLIFYIKPKHQARKLRVELTAHSILTRGVRTIGKTLSRPLGCFTCLVNGDENRTKTIAKWRNFFYTRGHFLFIIIIVNNFWKTFEGMNLLQFIRNRAAKIYDMLRWGIPWFKLDEWTMT